MTRIQLEIQYSAADTKICVNSTRPNSGQSNLTQGRIVIALPILRSPYTLNEPANIPLKNAHYRAGSGPRGSLGTRELAPPHTKGISIGSAVFIQLTRCLLYTSPSPRDS